MSKKVQLTAAVNRRKPPRLDARRAFVAGAKVERDREKLHVYVPHDLATAFRLYCARERLELSEVAGAALTMFLRSKGELGA